jgi:hypothetical protein
VIPPANAINLTATDKTHHAIANFVSTVALADEKEPGVKRRFTLPGLDTANMVFQLSGGGGCGAPSFEEPVSFSVSPTGVLTITPAPPAPPVTGRLFSNGAFEAGGATQQFIGAVQGDRVLLAYQGVVTLAGGAGDQARAALPSCTASYIGKGNLARPAVVTRRAACAKPSVVAPRSVRVTGGVAALRVGLSCGGDLVPGRTVDVFVARGKRRQRLGSFKTFRKLQKLSLRFTGSAVWDAVLLASRAGDVFKASPTARVVLSR